jgi:hypothetical protein
MTDRGGYLESVEEKPHAFTAHVLTDAPLRTA